MDRRISSGLQVKASYTFSKTINNVDNELGSLLFYDAANFQRNRALAGFDRPHNFRFAWVAELPFGKGKAGTLRADHFPIDAENVRIEGPLKELGLYTIKLHLGQDVTTEVKLWVVPTHTEEAAT